MWCNVVVIVLHYRYVMKYLTEADMGHTPPIGQFCDYLGADGVMVLDVISRNSSELIVRDVV
jgi:hypothetical protein